MTYPDEIGILVLPDVVLLPQSLLPLQIIDPQSQQLLLEALECDRVIAVAMENTCGCPASVGGLGLIRMCTKEKDFSYSVLLQGIKRIKFTEFTTKAPLFRGKFEVIEPLQTSRKDTLLLMKKILKHVNCPEEFLGDVGEIEMFLQNIRNYDLFVDLLASSLVTDPRRKQKLMETYSTESRLAQLSKWLSEDYHE